MERVYPDVTHTHSQQYTVMNEYVYNCFMNRKHNIKEYIRQRTEYKDPLGKALDDIFFYSYYDEDSSSRNAVLEAIEEGYITYREQIPKYNTDLIELTDKGKDYIRARMEFEVL